MRAAGIIAEYNPFHNGHLYQMEQVRAQTGADYVVVVMSGDFVQRGEPAVYDKYTRTAMALNCGADLVLELPSCFATGSAEDFAACGVALLDRLGVVDVLCFGSELGELAPLKTAASVLCREPAEFSEDLKKLLKQGMSYPAARSEALCRYLTQDAASNVSNTANAAAHWDYRSILASPNNILAVEYLKALKRMDSAIEPFTIQRIGQGYSDEKVPSHPGEFASATALRRLLCQNREPAISETMTEAAAETMAVAGSLPFTQSSHALCRLQGLIPDTALSALAKEQADSAPVFPDDLSLLLQHRILDLLKQGKPLSLYADMSPELASRLERRALDFSTFTGRIEQLKSRQYTYTRISRALLHLVLGITSEQQQKYREQGYALYARILGFRRSAAPLLAEIKKSSSIPLVTKTADAAGFLPPLSLAMLRDDLYASHLYQTLVFQKGRQMKNEYTKSVMILP